MNERNDSRMKSIDDPRASGARLARRHRVSRFLLRSRWVFRAAAGTADRRERTVIPEHFSPYKYTPYNIVIQIPDRLHTVSWSSRNATIMGYRRCRTPESMRAYQETPRYSRQWSYWTETSSCPRTLALRFLLISGRRFFFFYLRGIFFFWHRGVLRGVWFEGILLIIITRCKLRVD